MSEEPLGLEIEPTLKKREFDATAWAGGVLAKYSLSPEAMAKYQAMMVETWEKTWEDVSSGPIYDKLETFDMSPEAIRNIMDLLIDPKSSLAEDTVVEKAALKLGEPPKNVDELWAKVKETMEPVIDKISAKLGLPPRAK